MNVTEGTFSGYGGLQLAYRWWRPTEQRPRGARVVFVHGIGDHGGRHPHLVEALLAAGHEIIAPDMRGHGRSPGQRGWAGSWREYREDLRAVVEMAQAGAPARPLFLIGHSWGGLVVLEYALHYSEGLRGVIAMSPALSLEGIPRWKLAASRLLDRLLPRLSMKIGLRSEGLSRDPAVAEEAAEDPLCHNRGTVRLGVESRRAIEETLAGAPALRLSVLIVHGGSDVIVPAAASRAFVERVGSADKRLIEYQGAYHELDNDPARSEVLADIVRWIEERL